MRWRALDPASALNRVARSPRHRKESSHGLGLGSRQDPKVPTPCSLVPLLTQRGHDALLGQVWVLPHTGRGSSTITTWSEWCASVWSKGNSSGTQYPPQSTWSLAMPHVRCPINRRPSIPLVSNRLYSGQRARCLPQRGSTLETLKQMPRT